MVIKVTLIKVRKPLTQDVNQELQWLGSSLGLFNLRDKDSSCFRVFITLVKKSKRDEMVTSDQIAQMLNLTRGTVVHHLTRLMEAGLIIRESKGYLLRENNLQNIIRDIQKDIEGMFFELNKVATEIDEQLG